jgi:prephenate dehydrogenase
VVLLCTSILSTESVLQSLPLQRLKRNTLFVDVLSVKEFPKNLFLQVSSLTMVNYSEEAFRLCSSFGFRF